MQFGVVFPHHDTGSDPEVIADFAGALEYLGVGHLRVYDHVLGAQHSDREPCGVPEVCLACELQR